MWSRVLLLGLTAIFLLAVCSPVAGSDGRDPGLNLTGEPGDEQPWGSGGEGPNGGGGDAKIVIYPDTRLTVVPTFYFEVLTSYVWGRVSTWFSGESTVGVVARPTPSQIDKPRVSTKTVKSR
jgi:hypothetical protein